MSHLAEKKDIEVKESDYLDSSIFDGTSLLKQTKLVLFIISMLNDIWAMTLTPHLR